MDDTRRLGALLPVGIDMAHHVVPHLFLSRLRNVIIDVLRMAFQFVDLLLRDHRFPILGKPQLHLRLRQRDPKPPPRPKLHIRGENILHLPTRIPLRQGAYISVCTHLSLSFLS